MARETKIVNVYPSDEAVRAQTRLFEAFGWELVGNQKRTDDVGSYEGADGNYYVRTETYIQLTFSREKSSSWYKQVAELENDYYKAENEVATLMANEPKKAKYVGFFGVILCFTPLFFITVPLLIFNIVRQSKANKVYKEKHQEWLSQKYGVTDKVQKEKEKILAKAQALIDG